MKKIILLLTIFFCFSLFIPEKSIAQENTGSIDRDTIVLALKPLEEVRLAPPRLSEGESGEKQIWLYKNSPAPFNGVLLNPEAIAFILTEYEASFERAEAALEKQRASDMNRLKLEVGKLSLRLESEKKQSVVQITSLNNEINNLTNIHEDFIKQSNKNKRRAKILDSIKIIGGVVVGVAGGFLIGHFVVN